MPEPAPRAELADVQGLADPRGLAISRAGISGLSLPLRFVEVDGGSFDTVARASAWASVAAGERGAHMSRLVEEVGSLRAGLSLAALPGWLAGLAGRMGSERVGVDMLFPFFVDRPAPVSGTESWIDCEARLRASLDGGEARTEVTVTVPVTTLCPCSKEVSETGAHSQRSLLSVTVEVGGDAPVLRELATMAESHASASLHAVLKREDEKHVTEGAYARPRFAEDLVREVAAELMASGEHGGWEVSVRNMESIHNHDAFAGATSREV